MTARLIQVIETDFQLRGDGTLASPMRRVRQFWSIDGDLLAERDPEADREVSILSVNNVKQWLAEHQKFEAAAEVRQYEIDILNLKPSPLEAPR